MFLELVSKRKHEENYVKQMGIYHWTVVPIEKAEHFTGGRLLGEIQLSSPAPKFSFE